MFSISYHGLSCLKHFTLDRMLNPGVLFPLANVFSCFMTGNPSAISIALFNMVIVCMLAAEQIGILDLSFNKKSIGRHVNLLRFTAICTTVIAAIFLLGSNGASLQILLGMSFLAFSTGNFIQSSATTHAMKPTWNIVKALLHPALWYGVGYTFVGLTIAGGESIFNNMTAALFTLAGIVEIIASLGMSMGKVVNRAGPFIGITIGTAFLFAAGIATRNWTGAACAAVSGLGNLSLAIQTQQEQHREAQKTGIPVCLGILTRALQKFMNKTGIPKIMG